MWSLSLSSVPVWHAPEIFGEETTLRILPQPPGVKDCQRIECLLNLLGAKARWFAQWIKKSLHLSVPIRMVPQTHVPTTSCLLWMTIMTVCLSLPEPQVRVSIEPQVRVSIEGFPAWQLGPRPSSPFGPAVPPFPDSCIAQRSWDRYHCWRLTSTSQPESGTSMFRCFPFRFQSWWIRHAGDHPRCPRHN